MIPSRSLLVLLISLLSLLLHYFIFLILSEFGIFAWKNFTSMVPFFLGCFWLFEVVEQCWLSPMFLFSKWYLEICFVYIHFGVQISAYLATGETARQHSFSWWYSSYISLAMRGNPINFRKSKNILNTVLVYIDNENIAFNSHPSLICYV